MEWEMRYGRSCDDLGDRLLAEIGLEKGSRVRLFLIRPGSQNRD